jgi:hypothetical protein
MDYSTEPKAMTQNQIREQEKQRTKKNMIKTCYAPKHFFKARSTSRKNKL